MDLNFDMDYFAHPKTVRLVVLLGNGADVLPIRLWCHCGKYHETDGVLRGYSDKDVETVIGWWGVEGAAVEALRKVRFLVKQLDGSYQCHGWKERQGHIAALRERGRRMANIRWNRLRGDDAREQRPEPPQLVEVAPTAKDNPATFKKPTPREVTLYASEIGYVMDGDRFCDFYESKGWRVGKTPMKDWRACVRTWRSKDKEARRVENVGADGVGKGGHDGRGGGAHTSSGRGDALKGLSKRVDVP